MLDRVIGWPRGFPLGILVVNVSGSFALGIIAGLGAVVAPEVAVILGTGLLGGYTTFSAVAVDSALIAERGSLRHAAADAVGTLVLAVAAAAAGIALGMWGSGALAA